nr:MAG TPA: hypothetical protein [Caudoviricetes sp.]
MFLYLHLLCLYDKIVHANKYHNIKRAVRRIFLMALIVLLYGRYNIVMYYAIVTYYSSFVKHV